MTRVFLVTFGLVFLAELGDKTQLATLGLALKEHPLAVFLGSALALVTTSALAVLVGTTLKDRVDPLLLRRISGVLFVGLGIWALWPTSSIG